MNERDDDDAFEYFLEQTDILEILGSDEAADILWEVYFGGAKTQERIEKALRDEFQRLKMMDLEDQAEADYEAHKAWRDQ